MFSDTTHTTIPIAYCKTGMEIHSGRKGLPITTFDMFDKQINMISFVGKSMHAGCQQEIADNYLSASPKHSSLITA